MSAQAHGFFIMERLRDQGGKVIVPIPGSLLGPRHCRHKISAFVPAVPAGFLSRAAPLAASRHGLLLMRLLLDCRPPPGGGGGAPPLPPRPPHRLQPPACRKLPTRHWSSRTKRFCFGASGSFCHTDAVGDSTAHWLFRKKTPVTPRCYYLFAYHLEDGGGRVSMKGLPPSVRNYPESCRPCLNLAMDSTLSVLLMRSTTDHDPHNGVISYRDRVEIWS